ncbi:hypothetical protein [Streptomyces sp. NPDC049813]|uniref:hypothetical protein n=1 Tax=Streptomyces sp. NPDC049813 TaxID=3365597 RepID=UPI00379CE824
MTHTRPAPRVLALYPRRYRAVHGPEIAQLYRDATDGTDTRTRLREQADIAAHALRVRTFLSPRQPLGRFALTAAPYTLAAAVSIAAARTTTATTDALRDMDAAAWPATGALVTYVMTLAAGVSACTGRWPLARLTGAVALLLMRARAPVSGWLVPLLAVVVLMPGAAEPARTDRRLAVALAASTWLPVCAAALAGQSTPGLGMAGQLVPAMAVLGLRTAAPGCRPRHVLAVLAAALPWVTTPAGSPVGLAVVVAVLAAAWGVGRAAGRRGRAA